MDSNKLKTLIDIALTEVDNVVTKLKYFRVDQEPIISTKKVLILLKEEILHYPEQINERVQRAMHDLGMSAYKDFENTPLQKALNNVTKLLYNEIPFYKNLEPLRMDFGKGKPI